MKKWVLFVCSLLRNHFIWYCLELWEIANNHSQQSLFHINADFRLAMDRQYWKVQKLQIANKCAKVCKRDQTSRSYFAYIYIFKWIVNIFIGLKLYKCEKILFTKYIFVSDHTLWTKKKVVLIFSAIFTETNVPVIHDTHSCMSSQFEIMLIKVKFASQQLKHSQLLFWLNTTLKYSFYSLAVSITAMLSK